jgi:arylsulfatase A
MRNEIEKQRCTRMMQEIRHIGLLILVLSVGARAEPPNIIFVLADDISAKDLRCYNENGISLPTIEKLAKEGVCFETAWANAVCGPSRAVLQTGKYPYKQNHFENSVFPKKPLWKMHKLIGENMREAGYATGMYGKLHFLDCWPDQNPSMYGFDDYCIPKWWDGYDGDHGYPEKRTDGMYAVSWFWKPGMVINGKGTPTTENDFGPEIEFDRMRAFIARNKNTPFFVYWATYLPHMAHKANVSLKEGWYYTDVPELDADFRPTGKKIKGSLTSNMQYLDRKLEQLILYLEKENRMDNTILFVAGDNGTPGYGKNRYESEVAFHVPFLVWSPKRVPARGKSKVLIDFTDIYPTLTELGGGVIPTGIDGHSFANYLLDKKPFTPREWIFMQFGNSRWIRTDRWLLDGYGHLYDCGEWRDETTGYSGLKERKPLSSAIKDPSLGYKDVTHSPEYKSFRKAIEKILKRYPGPDYNDPEVAESWKEVAAR